MSSLAITLNNLTPPTVDSDDAGTTLYPSIISVNITFVIASQKYTNAKATKGTDSIAFTESVLTRTAIIDEIYSFPNSQGANGVYLYIEFTAPYELPSG